MNQHLSLHNLHKHFDGIKAVDDISLSFAPRKVTGLIGPNGSGKSTLINVLTGMTSWDSGIVMIGNTTKLSKVQSY